MGDQADEVGDQRHDAERSPARTARGAIGDREHDQRQQSRGSERLIEQQRGERGGGKRERAAPAAMVMNRARGVPSRTFAAMNKAMPKPRMRSVTGSAATLPISMTRKNVSHAGERGTQRGEQSQSTRIGRQQQSDDAHQRTCPSRLPAWL